MRTSLKPGTIITINGIQYEIKSLLSVSGGMSLIYEAQQQVESSGYAGRTVIKEFFPATNAARDDQGHVYCVSQAPEDIRRFDHMRQDLINEGIIGEEARNACSQVYAFDHASDGYAVMREFSRDTRSLADILNTWQKTPPSSDEEYTDMARVRYALRITHSLLTGLRTIHDSARIIHRDISLGNIVWASSDITKAGLDGRAYFLDFGSALRMDAHKEARNTTDPLKLFGTYSFAAPEIWQLGGTLTPSVDLFSISAILLVLCCGKKCCIRMKQGWHLASQANISRLYESDFVVRNAVEKLNIPAEIRGMLLDYLLEGLSKSPETRFNQSPDNMLEALERLQKKCAPRQRLREYVAFISYHHRPLDISVARHLHRMIEQYRIPKELSKGRESRRLGLVFRDEDELPVSTDLTDNIQEALDHSDFLIVVCTPGTPRSIWVEAEIEYFLRHHDRNHVLAVLAEGRPEESFPPHLVHLYDREGHVIGDTEYLAANIAGANKREVLRNLNREKLRIIAAMIGCPFDSLYHREKRHQLRQLAFFTCSGMVIGLIYIMLLLAKNAQITQRNQQISLQNDLISEQNQQLERQNQQLVQQKKEIQYSDSQLLADIAKDAIASGDYTTAIAKSIAALPASLSDDRPYYAKAESTLIESFGVFDRNYGHRPLIATDSLQYDTPISKFDTDSKGETLLVMEKYGSLSGIDLHTRQTQWKISVQPNDAENSINDPYVDMVICDRYSSVIGVYDHSLVCVSITDGKEIWRQELIYSAEPLLVLSSDQEYVAVGVMSTRGILTDDDFKQNTDAVILKASNGEVISRITVATNTGIAELTQRGLRISSQSSQYGAFYNNDACFAGYYYDLFDQIHYYVADIKTGTCRVIRSENIDYFKNKVIYFGISPLSDSIIIIKPSEADDIAATCECISLDSGDLLWKKNTPSKENHFKSVDGYNIQGLMGDTAILLGAKDELYCIDLVTGETIASVPLEANLTRMQWIYNHSVFSFVLANGYYALGWRTTSGFFDTRRIYDCYYYLQENSDARTSQGGFITPLIEHDRMTGINLENQNGRIMTMRNDSTQCLNISIPLPELRLDQDDVIAFPETGYYTGMTSMGGPGNTIQFAGDMALLTEWTNDKDTQQYKTFFMNRITHDISDTSVQFTDPDSTGAFLFSDGSGVLYINANTGQLSKYDFSKKQTITLTQPQQTLLSASDTSISYIGQTAMAAAEYREKDGKLLSVFCDGTQIRWWLDGEEQTPQSLPETTLWQYNGPKMVYRSLTIGTNGIIMLSDFGPNASSDRFQAFIGYDTLNSKWLRTEDLSHESADRIFAVGTAHPLFASLDSDMYLRIYDMEQNSLVSMIPIEKPRRYLERVDFFYNDENIIITTSDNKIVIYCIHDANCLYEGDLEQRGKTRAVVDSKGHRTYIYDTVTQSGIVFDTQTWSELARIDNICAFDPLTDEIYIDNGTSGISIRKVPALQEMIDRGKEVLRNLVFSPSP